MLPQGLTWNAIYSTSVEISWRNEAGRTYVVAVRRPNDNSGCSGTVNALNARSPVSEAI